MLILIVIVMFIVVKGWEYYYYLILFCNLKKMNKLKKNDWICEWMVIKVLFYLVLEIFIRLY